MLRALDRVAPAKLAIPLGIVTAGGLVILGMRQPTIALIAGIGLLAGALLLSLSARWRLAGNPDPLTAGVHFETPDQPAARRLGLACVILGGAVLGYGAWDTVQTRLTTAWDPMRGAWALTVDPTGYDAPPSEPPAQATATAVSTPPGRVERPAARTGPDGILRIEPIDGDPEQATAQGPKLSPPNEHAARAPKPTRIDPAKPADNWAVNYERTTERDRAAELAAAKAAAKDEAARQRQNMAKPVANFEALMKKARKEMMAGRNRQAIQLAKQARRANPKSTKPLQVLCLTYQKLGSKSSALKNCSAWLKREPNSRLKPRIEAMIRKLGG